MDLWIRSQDKIQLVKVIGCYYDYQQEKHHITVITENDYYWVGIYKTKERALEVLDEIQEYLCYDKFNYEDKDRTCYQDCSCYKSDIVMVYEMPKE